MAPLATPNNPADTCLRLRLAPLQSVILRLKERPLILQPLEHHLLGGKLLRQLRAISKSDSKKARREGARGERHGVRRGEQG